MPDENMRAASENDAAGTLVADRALHAGAALFARRDRLRLRFDGAHAGETLNGLVTSNVAALTPGTGQYGVALTPKGKIIADVRIFAVEESFLVDVPAAAAPGFAAMIRKYVNPRLARYSDLGDSLSALVCAGPTALDLVARILDLEPLSELPLYGHTRTAVDGATVMVARVDDIGVAGCEIFTDSESVARLETLLMDRGAVPATADALTMARVEAGRPEWGTDMDDTTLAQEADMDRLGAIAYDKGCYTGQETVARVHFRGHVNRLLRGLRFPDDAHPDTGTELCSEGGKPVGRLTSVVRSPRFGTIGLALIRREVEPGSLLQAGDGAARVVGLPFEHD